MPRVSEAHLAARRQQILDAAARRFARDGFHATSMQDVIAEAGLSVGAVYRYFRGKEDLGRAVVDENVGAIETALSAIAGHEPALPLSEAMARVYAVVEPRLNPGGAAHLALQMWAEALRDEEVAGYVASAYGRLRALFIEMVRRAQAAGHVAPEVDPNTYAYALFAMVLGYLLQRILTGAPSEQEMLAAVRAVLGTVAR